MKSISLPHIYSDRLMLFIINSIVTSSLHNRIRNYIKKQDITLFTDNQLQVLSV